MELFKHLGIEQEFNKQERTTTYSANSQYPHAASSAITRNDLLQQRGHHLLDVLLSNQ